MMKLWFIYQLFNQINIIAHVILYIIIVQNKYIKNTTTTKLISALPARCTRAIFCPPLFWRKYCNLGFADFDPKGSIRLKFSLITISYVPSFPSLLLNGIPQASELKKKRKRKSKIDADLIFDLHWLLVTCGGPSPRTTKLIFAFEIHLKSWL